MPPAIEIEIQAERQRLPNLDAQAVTWGSCRKRVFDRGGETFDRSSAVEPTPKPSSHLCPRSADVQGFLAALCWDHALRREFLPNVGVTLVAVEFGIGQYRAAGCLLRRCCGYRSQIRESLQGPRLAICASKSCWFKSATTTHFSQCHHRSGSCS